MIQKPDLMASDPTLRDLFTLHTTEVLLATNCHHIGTVQSFDSDSHTVEVLINYNQTVFDDQGNRSFVNYPILSQVPIIIIGGGGCAVTFPIAAGDQCLLCFNDRDLDNWLEAFPSSVVGALNSPRMHSFADAVALIGFQQIASYDGIRALLSNGTVSIGINPLTSKATITNGVSLGTILNSLMTQISALNTALVTLTSAMSTATPATVVAQIATPSGVANGVLTGLIATLTVTTTELGVLLE